MNKNNTELRFRIETERFILLRVNHLTEGEALLIDKKNGESEQVYLSLDVLRSLLELEYEQEKLLRKEFVIC